MNETGHMLVARIAWNHMRPQAQKALIAILADPHNPDIQQDTTAIDGDQLDEKTWNYGAACFMDDAKNEAREHKKPGCPCNDEAGLHFDDQPVGDPQYFPAAKNVPNAVSTVDAKVAVLEGKVSATKDQQAEGARDLMHLPGDLEQPLHCATRFNAQYPKGDAGGNAVLINYLPGTPKYPTELHGLMDAGGARPNADGTANVVCWGDIKRPLLSNPASMDLLTQMSSSVEGKWPMASFNTQQLSDLDPNHWAAEGKNLAETVVYPGIDAALARSADHKTLAVGDPFLTQMADLMEKQAALAGYRMANLFNSIYCGQQ